MKDYPIEKYKFHICGNMIIAETTYAGRRIKARAKCAPEDAFDITKGKELAAARCNLKVALRRRQRADRKLDEAHDAYIRADKFYEDMNRYYYDADQAVEDAYDRIDEIKNEL